MSIVSWQDLGQDIPWRVDREFALMSTSLFILRLVVFCRPRSLQRVVIAKYADCALLLLYLIAAVNLAV